MSRLVAVLLDGRRGPSPRQLLRSYLDTVPDTGQLPDRLRNISFGFSIRTPSWNDLQDEAYEQGHNWNALDRGALFELSRAVNEGVAKIEREAVDWLESRGLRVRDEGHANDDELVGTAWLGPTVYGLNLVKQYLRFDEPIKVPSDALTLVEVADGVVLSATVSFFDTDELEAAIEEEGFYTRHHDPTRPRAHRP